MRASFLLLAGLLCLGCGDTKSRLEGAGSSFVDPMMQEWAGLYKKAKGVPVNYQSKGSGAGIKMMTGQEVDFGCSDAPLNDEQLSECKAAGGDVIHVPLCMGAIVPAYNLPDLPDLTFDGPTLIAIFLGKITRWNDPALAKLNPGKDLPDVKISVAFRSDASGSSYILTDYFTQIDADAWTPGKGTAPKFPTGTGAKGNDGVAGLVKGTRGDDRLRRAGLCPEERHPLRPRRQRQGQGGQGGDEERHRRGGDGADPRRPALLDRQRAGRGRLPDQRDGVGDRLRQAGGVGRQAQGLPVVGDARGPEGDRETPLCRPCPRVW